FNTVFDYLRRFEICRDVKRHQENLRLDIAEEKLLQAAERGEEWATRFLLKTKGKHRGYYEQIKGGVEQSVPIAERVARINDLLDAARARRAELADAQDGPQEG